MSQYRKSGLSTRFQRNPTRSCGPPSAVANRLIRAAGGLALQRAGATLDQRFPEMAEQLSAVPAAGSSGRRDGCLSISAQDALFCDPDGGQCRHYPGACRPYSPSLQSVQPRLDMDATKLRQIIEKLDQALEHPLLIRGGAAVLAHELARFKTDPVVQDNLRYLVEDLL